MKRRQHGEGGRDLRRYPEPSAVLLLGALCAGAAALAARRVTRVEPMRVLREE